MKSKSLPTYTDRNKIENTVRTEFRWSMSHPSTTSTPSKCGAVHPYTLAYVYRRIAVNDALVK